MADKAGLGSIIGVGVGTSKAELRVPRISSGNVAGATSEVSLGLEAGSLGSGVGGADVGELIADAVHDDGRVERLLLALVDKRVDGLEGELGSLAAVESGLLCVSHRKLGSLVDLGFWTDLKLQSRLASTKV